MPEGTVAIAIPFYLARPDLTALHAGRAGHVEGVGRADILRYLRHEMGHVVNYAYAPVRGPRVGRRDSVRSPSRIARTTAPSPSAAGSSATCPAGTPQKHPDEDWSETFAVWMTPGLDWRAEYADWPEALAKLQYCDRTIAALADREPVVTADDLDEDVGEIAYTLDHYYRRLADQPTDYFPPRWTAPCARSSRTWTTSAPSPRGHPARAGLGPDPPPGSGTSAAPSTSGRATSPSAPAPCSATSADAPTR